MTQNERYTELIDAVKCTARFVFTWIRLFFQPSPSFHHLHIHLWPVLHPFACQLPPKMWLYRPRLALKPWEYFLLNQWEALEECNESANLLTKLIFSFGSIPTIHHTRPRRLILLGPLTVNLISTYAFGKIISWACALSISHLGRCIHNNHK